MQKLVFFASGLILSGVTACIPASSLGPRPNISKTNHVVISPSRGSVTVPVNSVNSLPADPASSIVPVASQLPASTPTPVTIPAVSPPPLVFPFSFASCSTLSAETGLSSMGFLKTVTFLSDTKAQTVEQFKGSKDCTKTLTDAQLELLISFDAESVIDSSSPPTAPSPTPLTATQKAALKKEYLDGEVISGSWVTTAITGLEGTLDLGTGRNATFQIFKKSADGKKLILSVVCTKIDSDSGYCNTVVGTTKANRSTDFSDGEVFDRVGP
ncbi:MAG: hypothetical protein H7249_04065 [Chitinophagaceae bacterium]|nr:hypothetical protein [Oligoflexus sp.]